MAFRTYPVKLYYYHNYQGQRIWFKTRNEAISAAVGHADAVKLSRLMQVYEMEFPRTLNADVALQLLQYRLSGFNTKLIYQYRHISQQHTPKPKPTDPYELLGLVRPTTREQLAEAFKKAAQRYHPDRGGTNEAMQAVNSARDHIRRANGW